MSWKVAVREGRVTFSIDGRVVLERPGHARFRPLARDRVARPARRLGQEFRDHGKPSIPERLKLSSFPELTGWSADEYPSLAVANELPLAKTRR